MDDLVRVDDTEKAVVEVEIEVSEEAGDRLTTERTYSREFKQIGVVVHIPNLPPPPPPD